MNEISKRILETMERANISYGELSIKTGYSKSVLQRYATGAVDNIPVDRIKGIAKALNISAAYLMGWEDSRIAIDKNKWHAIPIYDGIAAGQPTFAEDLIVGFECIECIDPDEHFFLVVHGDSMMNARICEGDMVLVRRQACADNGQIVACLINGDSATLKRYRIHGDTVILQPENPKYEPILLPTSEFESGYARILGVVEKVVFKV